MYLWFFKNKSDIKKTTKKVLLIAKKASKYTKTTADDKVLNWAGKSIDHIFSMIPENKIEDFAKEITDDKTKELRGVEIDVDTEKAGLSVSGKKVSAKVSYNIKTGKPTYGLNIKL